MSLFATVHEKCLNSARRDFRKYIFHQFCLFIHKLTNMLWIMSNLNIAKFLRGIFSHWPLKCSSFVITVYFEHICMESSNTQTVQWHFGLVVLLFDTKTLERMFGYVGQYLQSLVIPCNFKIWILLPYNFLYFWLQVVNLMRNNDKNQNLDQICNENLMSIITLMLATWLKKAHPIGVAKIKMKPTKVIWIGVLAHGYRLKNPRLAKLCTAIGVITIDMEIPNVWSYFSGEIHERSLDIPIPGIAIAIRLAHTALIPWIAAFFDATSKLLYWSSTNWIPFFNSLGINVNENGTLNLHFNRNLEFLAYCIRIIGMLIQFAAATATRGTNRPTKGFIFFVSRFNVRAVVNAPPVAITYDVRSWLVKLNKMFLKWFKLLGRMWICLTLCQ